VIQCLHSQQCIIPPSTKGLHLMCFHRLYLIIRQKLLLGRSKVNWMEMRLITIMSVRVQWIKRWWRKIIDIIKSSVQDIQWKCILISLKCHLICNNSKWEYRICRMKWMKVWIWSIVKESLIVWSKIQSARIKEFEFSITTT
jgi:hypothetical protein